MPGLLIAILILGAVGLFLAMPGGRANVARLGQVGLAAGGALVLVLLTRALPAQATGGASGWFLVATVVALFAAARVITHKKPVYSALYFVLLVVAVTTLLMLMDAKFLGMALVIVYGGAILVTYVFVIMLAQQSRPAPYDAQSREPFWGCLAGFALLWALTGYFGVGAGPVEGQAAGLAEAVGTIERIGIALYTDYVVAIQMIGLLLLAAMVGAIAIARRQPMPDTEFEAEGEV